MARRRLVILLLAASSAAALLLVVLAALWRIYGGMVDTSYEDARRRLDLLPHPVHAVVLGMGRAPILDRADLAADLWKRGHVRAFVTAGGQGPDEAEPESTTLRRALEAHGVPPAAITEESASRNTRENLANAKPILTAAGAFGQPVIVVTHHYHGQRAREIAAAAGYDAIVVTTDGPRLDRLPFRLAREVLSYLRWRIVCIVS